MIKVLHILGKMDMAGQETFLMNVYRAIDRERYDFLFLCSDPSEGDYDGEIRTLGGEVFHLPTPSKEHGVLKYTQIIGNLTRWLRENREKFDIVQLHTHHALDVFCHLEACRRAKVKKVIIHSHNTDGPHRLLHRVMRAVNNIFYDYRKFCCSEEAGEWLFGKRAVARGEALVILNCIDTVKFGYSKEAAEEIARELGITGKRVIGHVGRFSEQKNHSFLTDVFAEYAKRDPDSVMVLVGRGELEGEIRKKAEDLGLSDRIIFAGVREDVERVMSAFDIFVFPSLFEGLGRVVIEAQYNGLNVIANENLPNEAVISERMTRLPISDPVVWADAVERLIGKRGSDITTDKFELKHTTALLEREYAAMAEENA